MSDTLVLDTLGFPVAFVSWQRAVNLQWQDRAVVVTEDAKRVLRSPSFEMGMPRVNRSRVHIVLRSRTVQEASRDLVTESTRSEVHADPDPALLIFEDVNVVIAAR